MTTVEVAAGGGGGGGAGASCYLCHRCLPNGLSEDTAIGPLDNSALI